MKYKLLLYSHEHSAHFCKDEKGKFHWINFIANGEFPPLTTPQSLTNKILEAKKIIEYIKDPSISIATQISTSHTT